MLLGVLLVFYLVVTLFSLNALPVFSDEAIYIRWAQIAWHEPEKYLFYPMLDGKTPLHVWLIMPLLKLIPDPLLAGRLLSVLIGVCSIIIIGKIMKQLGGKLADVRLAQFFAILLPFWFFHNRMALADALLTFFLILGLYFGFHAYEQKSIKWIGLFAVAVGAALWTKVSALFFIPMFVCIPILVEVVKKKKFTIQLIRAYFSVGLIKLAVGGCIGVLIFLTLKFTPLFPYLFMRSADYTFSIQDLLHGEWKFVLFSATPRLFYWIAWYLSPFVLLLALFSGVRGGVLMMMGLLYAAPLLIFGRVTYSRYFLPMAVPFTLMAVMGYRWLVEHHKKSFAIACVIGAMLWSAVFILPSYFFPLYTPFAREDVIQYVTEWSSGVGIPQVRDFLIQAKKDRPIKVGTEGYFGTLPEGLQIYFDRPVDAQNIVIDGVGQPIRSIPSMLVESAKTQDTYLVVNSHRFLFDDRSQFELLNAYARPYGGPSLLLLRILPEKR